MSRLGVERAIGKLVTDAAFRGRFFKDPAAASFCAGLDLCPAELDALSRISPRLLAQFSLRIDDRIRRLVVEDIPESFEGRR